MSAALRAFAPAEAAAADATHLRRLHCGKWSAGSAQRFAAAPAPLLDAPYPRADAAISVCAYPSPQLESRPGHHGLYFPMGRETAQVLRLVADETVLLTSREKAPFLLLVEVWRCIAVILHAPLFLTLRSPQVLTAERPAQVAKASSEAVCTPASPAVASKVRLALCATSTTFPPLRRSLRFCAHADRVRSGVCAAVFDRHPARRGGRVRTRAALALASRRAAARTAAPCAPPHSLRCVQFSMRGDTHQR